jgi:glycosyltransferase involved in cell wall biosynthesis
MVGNQNLPFLNRSSIPFQLPSSPVGMVVPPQPAVQPQPKQDSITPPELSLPRFLNYYADYSGCGHWRMIWPEQILNAQMKAVVHGTTVMNLDPRYYGMVKSVRIQRQATKQQLEFVKHLKEISKHNGMRLIYEIDDICFEEDIPDYNKYKPAFVNPEIRESAQAIMSMCDEITVTCDFMRDYYRSKTGNKNVTVIPNFMPKFWMDRYFDLTKNMNNLDKYKKKPRILYAGSGAHFDVDNRVKQRDDFEHVVQAIRQTVDKYQWVFLGAFPLPLMDLVKNGKIEFQPWKRLLDYPESVSNLNVNMLVAPLQDNIFNRSKSDLKYIEACAFGLPIACQDMCTYANAPIKFKTGSEMIDRIDETLKDVSKYRAICKAGRQYAETRWMETDKNIDCYLEMYGTPYGDPSRVNLKRYN